MFMYFTWLHTNSCKILKVAPIIKLATNMQTLQGIVRLDFYKIFTGFYRPSYIQLLYTVDCSIRKSYIIHCHIVFYSFCIAVLKEEVFLVSN